MTCYTCVDTHSCKCTRLSGFSLSASFPVLYRALWTDLHQIWYTGCFKKVSPSKTFRNIFISVKSFCVKFFEFVDNSYPHISTNFYRFILIFHQMALIFPRVPIVFTPSSFEYSPIKWKCSVPASEMTSFFRHQVS